MYRQIWEDLIVSDSISRTLHGGNFVATANSIALGDPSASISETLSLSSLRFPGGDVTERYLSPTGQTWFEWISSEQPTITLPNGRSFATLRSFTNFASQQNSEISLVLPTEGLLIRNTDGSISVDQEALREVISLSTDLLTGSYGNVSIRQFEIGNEYYLNNRLTAAEYGLVANEMVKQLGQAFTAISESRAFNLFNRPDLLLQAGAPWQINDNRIILESLDASARENVDGVIIHWYPRNLARIDNLKSHFRSIQEWQNADGLSDVKLHVTEWNIFNGPTADTGLYQASSLIESYERLTIEDVDSADIWGVSFPRLLTRLAAPGANAPPDEIGFFLTPSGEVIRSLFSSTADLHVLAVEMQQVVNNSSELGLENVDYTISSYGDADRAIVYISSRQDEVVQLNLDVNLLFRDAHHVVIQTFELHDDPTSTINEADPNFAPYSKVETRTYTKDEFSNLVVELEPGEIAKIEYLVGNVGFNFSGQIGTPIQGISYSDTILGSNYADTLQGQQGHDLILGAKGNDILDGGSGNDQLYGGDDRDVIKGEADGDRLFGGLSSDILFGGQGDDTIQGGNGDDILFGGSNDDIIKGGQGDDTLVAIDGDDILSGGEGRDIFSVSTTNNSIIEDWSYESGDQISFQGQYEVASDVRARMVEVQYSDGRPGDLIIEHDGGTSTTIRGAAGQQDYVAERLFDYTPIAQNTLSQVSLLSSLTPTQVKAITEALGSDEYHVYRSSIDPTLLAQNLDGKRLSSFLNGMNVDEANEFLQAIPEEARSELLQEMSRTELNSLIGALEYDQLIALMQNLSSSTFGSFASRLDDTSLTSVKNAIARFKVDPDDQEHEREPSSIDDLEWLESIQSENSQPTPRPPEDVESGDNGTAKPDPQFVEVSAGCFIATAVYANSNHPNVWLLRWYRDEVLRRYGIGRALIAVYWLIGPKCAEFVSKRAILVHAFLIIFHLLVRIICTYYNRQPGRQADHRDYPDSRLIKVGKAAAFIARSREVL